MTIVPSVYFGNIFYWHSVFGAEEICIDRGEFFIKQTYRNRAEIATEKGVTPLIIPLEKGKNSGQPMSRVRISYAENWQALHFKTICSAYGKAAYFEHYRPELEAMFKQRPEHLCTWNTIWFDFFANEFGGISGTVSLSENYVEAQPSDTDLRPLMHPKAENGFVHKRYYHVFFDKYPQPQNLSVLDLLMNEGPHGIFILR